MPLDDDIRTLPTWLEIDLDALLHNISHIRSRLRGAPPPQIMLTVKADAYGHGAVQVAAVAEPIIDRFGVATVDEAIELADAGISKKILILSPILDSEIPQVVAHDFALTVSSLPFAEAVSHAASRVRKTIDVHVEVDTGMGRTGFLVDEVAAVAGHVAGLPGLHLAGLYTHFPVADTDHDFTREQLSRFRTTIDSLASAGFTAPVVHAANSAAALGVDDTHLHMVRPGLAAYGVDPGGIDPSSLRPVMSWKCRIVQVRSVPSGTPISYGRTFVTRRRTLMGVLPVGYGHGYPFRLTNCGEVLVAGRRAPVMGRVTMDMTMVDLTDVTPAPKAGDEVVLIGRQKGNIIRAEDVADRAGTISYEILTGVGKRVARLYRRDGRAVVLKTLLGIRYAG